MTEDIEAIVARLFENMYDFSKEMGKKIGRDIVRKGVVRITEGEVLMADLVATAERAMVSGYKEGLFEETKNPFLTEDEPEPAESIPAFASVEQALPVEEPKDKAKKPRRGRVDGTRMMVNNRGRKRAVMPQDIDRYLKWGWYFKMNPENEDEIMGMMDRCPPPDWYKKKFLKSDKKE